MQCLPGTMVIGHNGHDIYKFKKNRTIDLAKDIAIFVPPTILSMTLHNICKHRSVGH